MDFAKKGLSKFNEVISTQSAQLAILAAVLFFVFANVSILRFVDGLLKKLNINLSANMLVLVHAAVFGLVYYFASQELLGRFVKLIKSLKL